MDASNELRDVQCRLRELTRATTLPDFRVNLTKATHLASLGAFSRSPPPSRQEGPIRPFSSVLVEQLFQLRHLREDTRELRVDVGEALCAQVEQTHVLAEAAEKYHMMAELDEVRKRCLSALLVEHFSRLYVLHDTEQLLASQLRATQSCDHRLVQQHLERHRLESGASVATDHEQSAPGLAQQLLGALSQADSELSALKADGAAAHAAHRTMVVQQLRRLEACYEAHRATIQARLSQYKHRLGPDYAVSREEELFYEELYGRPDPLEHYRWPADRSSYGR